MTREEKSAKYYLSRLLSSDGYPTYAKIFSRFDLHLTSDPNVIAYMEPTKGTITINRGLDENQASVTIRHEILHDYLQHEKRLLDKLAKDRGINPDDLDDLTINDLRKDLYSNADFNIAADYEISNRGYTDKDKQNIRNINLNGRILSGLVTEDEHPDWIDLSVEEMFDKLKKEKQKMKPEDNAIMGAFDGDDVFIAADGTIYAPPETLEKLKKMWEAAANG